MQWYNDEEEKDLEKDLQSVFPRNDDEDDDKIAGDCPGIEYILIYERNLYMACKLQQSLAFLLVPQEEEKQQ